jgi:hypothetical protein
MTENREDLVSGKEMCESISAYWKEARGIEVEPEAIWDHSPTGDISRICEWYIEAKTWDDWRIANPEKWAECKAELDALPKP